MLERTVRPPANPLGISIRTTVVLLGTLLVGSTVSTGCGVADTQSTAPEYQDQPAQVDGGGRGTWTYQSGRVEQTDAEGVRLVLFAEAHDSPCSVDVTRNYNDEDEPARQVKAFNLGLDATRYEVTTGSDAPTINVSFGNEGFVANAGYVEFDEVGDQQVKGKIVGVNEDGGVEVNGRYAVTRCDG